MCSNDYKAANCSDMTLVHNKLHRVINWKIPVIAVIQWTQITTIVCVGETFFSLKLVPRYYKELEKGVLQENCDQ
jgi:hypothetical protein